MALIRSGQQADFTFQVDGAPADKLRVASFRGVEAISRPFRFHLELVSTDGAVDLRAAVGKPAVLTIAGTEGKRYVHGVVLRMEQLGRGDRLTTYEAVLVPEIALLSFRARSRIYPNMDVKEIVTKVLTESGLATDRFKFSLQASYPKREHCVQYRETHLNFVSRLLEEEGIYYFFEHSQSGHVLVMADSNGAMSAIPGTSKLRYRPPAGQIPEEEHLLDVRFGEEFRSGKSVLRDYFYEKPAVDLTATGEADAQADFEIYDFPGGYEDPSEGKRLAKTRLEEMRATRAQGSASATCRRMVPGFRFEMYDHPRKDFNSEYVALRVQHSGSHPQVREEEGSGESNEPLYHAEVDFFPSKTPYRPDRLTPKPVIYGTHTAVVVGPNNSDSYDDKVYLDDLGRARIRFHWDRVEWNKDAQETCWVRVSQGYAGATHGIQFPPLVGDEVLVDFVEGDPDRPIVTGRVYHGTNKPPLKPADKVQNVILTPYQHRLMLDDKKTSVTLNTGGSETLHLGDALEDKDFGNNIRLSTADGHYIQLAKGDKHKGLMIETEAKHKIEVRDDPNPGLFLVDKNGTIYLHLDTDNKTIAVINDAQGEIQVKVAGGKVSVVGSEITVDAEQKLTLKAGAEIKAEAPKITIDAQTELAASGGAKASVSGTSLELKGDAAAKMSGGATAEVSGGAMTTIKGGVVMIN